MIKLIFCILIFTSALFLIGQNLEKPFWGEHDWNGVRYGNIARNYLRSGLIDLRFAQVENSGPINQQELIYYTHYPPLNPILISISYTVFGVSEWSTRLVPLLATSGSLVLIFLIGTSLFNLKTGFLAALLGLFTPMVLYFGKNVSHEPLALFFILVAFYGYILKGKTKYWLFIFSVGLILAELTAWAGYFLVPTITLVAVIKKDFKVIRFIIPFWILSVVIFILHTTHVFLVTGNLSGGGFFEALTQRSGLSSGVQPDEFNIPNYVNNLRLWFSTLFTITLTSVSLIWVIKTIKGKLKGNIELLVLGLVGVIYLLVFSNAAFIHNYLIFYFLPFLSLSAAVTLISLKRVRYFKKSYLLMIFIILFAVFFERRAYLEALNKSDVDKFAVEVGRAINQQTDFTDKILISPVKFSYSADKFLRFYSDRDLTYSDSKQEGYDIWVLVNQDEGKFEIIRTCCARSMR